VKKEVLLEALATFIKHLDLDTVREFGDDKYRFTLAAKKSSRNRIKADLNFEEIDDAS